MLYITKNIEHFRLEASVLYGCKVLKRRLVHSVAVGIVA